MMNAAQNFWNQYALVTELAWRMQGRPFGRTALQKLTFLLQELFGVDTGYEFPLYTYGPYSSELSSDLDTLAVMQGVSVQQDSRQVGYLIAPGPRSESIRSMGAQFLQEHDSAIQRVVSDFGGMSAKELELRATLVFADRDARRRGRSLEPEALVAVVHEIKPHFAEHVIETVRKDLAGRGYLDAS